MKTILLALFALAASALAHLGIDARVCAKIYGKPEWVEADRIAYRSGVWSLIMTFAADGKCDQANYRKFVATTKEARLPDSWPPISESEILSILRVNGAGQWVEIAEKHGNRSWKSPAGDIANYSSKLHYLQITSVRLIAKWAAESDERFRQQDEDFLRRFQVR